MIIGYVLEIDQSLILLAKKLTRIVKDKCLVYIFTLYFFFAGVSKK